MPEMDRHAVSSWVPPACALFVVAAMLTTTPALAQQANGTLHANGRSAKLEHAIAVEVDSATEPGYLDVVVVLSDRRLSAAQARDAAGLEAMSRRDGLVALRVVLNPDAKVTSAEPLHPAFTTFVSSALWVRFEPTAYDEKRIAGRLRTPGPQNEFRQQWSYDVSFSAPIVLDPDATTVPRR
ncbi:MAG: hypothetical protein IPF73_11600 [Betaproteobacteria bacterium]|nr:hypothetical protein [Betaproteobacteria bacterium]